MHMADALVSPPVGGAMLAASAVVTAASARTVRQEGDTAKIPLMGVLGAFVFAAQMINFSIPGTGSSGHLGGGLLLAILLGPAEAYLVIASVLTIQALFFADGGLLALGCNLFNIGVLPAFVAYPLIYRRIAGKRPVSASVAAFVAAVAGLALGAVGVVLQTTASGVSELPFGAFLAVMLPIHVVIGAVEGIATAVVVSFVRRAQPEILERRAERKGLQGVRLRSVLVTFLVAALISGAGLSWFASADPDGLEWSIERVTGGRAVSGTDGVLKEFSAAVTRRTAVFPDYALPDRAVPMDESDGPAADATLAGGIGAIITLLAVVAVGALLSHRAKHHRI